MEVTMKDQQQDQQQEQQNSSVVSGKSKLLRYPLRSATKKPMEEEKKMELSNSASRRERSISSVSKSMGMLDLSGKDKSASNKPPRRLSVPPKSLASSAQKPSGHITPISEVRSKRNSSVHAKPETPLSDVSRASSTRMRFSRVASTLYWISQIKLFEAAGKHSISLAFFKLAVEAGCEPLQKMRDELKSYVKRHELTENGEIVKDLFETYNIQDNKTQEQVQVTENCSQVPEEGTRSSDDEVRSPTSTAASRKLKPRSLNPNAAPVSSAAESVKDETTQKKITASRTRGTWTKISANSVTASETRSHKLEKKPTKQSNQTTTKEKGKMKKPGKNSAPEQGPVSPPAADDIPDGDKENMDAPMEEISLVEAA